MEREIRKIRYFNTYEEALDEFNLLISHNDDHPRPLQMYTMYYLESYRMNSNDHGTIDLKIPAQPKKAIYFNSTWFTLCISREIPYSKWTRAQHQRFAHLSGHIDALTEERCELPLPHHGKFYVFRRSDRKYGVAFEMEYTKLTDLSSILPAYKHLYQDMKEDLPPTPSLDFIQRKSVHPCTRAPKEPHLRAHKYDGIYGYVLCYPNEMYEIWEDNLVKKLKFDSFLYPGIVFAAERLPSNHIILLDVLSYGKYPTYRKNMKYILLDFLNDCRKSQILPSHYLVQIYSEKKSSSLPIQLVANRTDGVIYHTLFTDRVFKLKQVDTIELMYEKGQLWSFTQSFPVDEKTCIISLEEGENMEEGHVYECELKKDKVIVLKHRPDRFLCNSNAQILSSILHSIRKRKK